MGVGGEEANSLARVYNWGGLGESGDEEEDEDEEDEEGKEADGAGDGGMEEDDVIEIDGGDGGEDNEGMGVVAKAGEGTTGKEALPIEDVLRFLSTGRQS